MTPRDKYVRLLKLLNERTTERKINWGRDGDGDPRAMVGSNYITLYNHTNSDGEPTEVVRVTSPDGEILDVFTDEVLAGLKPEPGRSATYWELMRDTRTKAYRQATGADVAIDDILSALEDDDEGPF